MTHIDCKPVVHIYLVITVACGLAACDSVPQRTERGEITTTATMSLGQKPVVGAEALEVPFRRFKLERQPGLSLTVSVTGKGQADAPKKGMHPGKATAIGSATAAGGVGYAMLIPMAGGVAVGGILLLPLLVIPTSLHATQRATIIETSTEFAFPKRLEEQLRDTLGANATTAEPIDEASVKVEVQIARFGFTGSPSTPACVVFSAELVVLEGGEERFRDRIVWRGGERSADLPPVRCAHLSDLAARDGALIREILNEATIVIAAAVSRRLSG